MSANDTTKIQLNYKLADGTLVNIYGQDANDLLTQIQATSQLAQEIIKLGATLNSRGPVPIFAPAQAAPAQPSPEQLIAERLGGEVISVATTPAPQIVDARHCKHGERQYRESKPGAPKQWKGYFCPSPKGTPDQCEPNFVRG